MEKQIIKFYQNWTETEKSLKQRMDNWKTESLKSNPNLNVEYGGWNHTDNSYEMISWENNKRQNELEQFYTTTKDNCRIYDLNGTYFQFEYLKNIYELSKPHLDEYGFIYMYYPNQLNFKLEDIKKGLGNEFDIRKRIGINYEFNHKNNLNNHIISATHEYVTGICNFSDIDIFVHNKFNHQKVIKIKIFS